MISTATAGTSAASKVPSIRYQTTAVTAATAITIGTKIRDATGEPLHRRLGALCLGDQARSARAPCPAPRGSPRPFAGRRPVHGRPGDLVARVFSTGDGLARQHRLVDRRRALEHPAVHRDLLARQDLQRPADLDGVDGHLQLLVVPQHPGVLRPHLEEALDGLGCPAPALASSHRPSDRNAMMIAALSKYRLGSSIGMPDATSSRLLRCAHTEYR